MAAWTRETDALLKAACRLDVEGMRKALQAGAHPILPEYGAARRVCVAKTLLKLDEDVYTTRQLAALRLLADYGGLDAATASAALPNATGHCCAPAVVQALLDRGADVRHQDKFGCAPLHHVQRADVVQLLVAAGGDVNAADSEGRRPLHLHALLGDTSQQKRQAMLALVAAGAHVNAVTSDGKTSLNCAVDASWRTRVHETVRLLLEAGADPTIAATDGRTPLMRVISLSKAIVDIALLTGSKTVTRCSSARRPGGGAGTCC